MSGLKAIRLILLTTFLFVVSLLLVETQSDVKAAVVAVDSSGRVIGSSYVHNGLSDNEMSLAIKTVLEEIIESR